MQAPKLPSFFRFKKPNRFDYQPIYYDERKEKMEERYERISEELAIEKKEGRTTITKVQLREEWGRVSRNGKQTNKMAFIIYIYIIVLLGLVYYIFFK